MVKRFSGAKGSTKSSIMNITMCYILFSLLAISFVSAETFSTGISISIDGNNLTIEGEGLSDSFEINETSSKDYTISISREVDVNDPDYDILINKINSFSELINSGIGENISRDVDQNVDSSFASQQDWLENTFMPSIEELNTCQSEKNSYLVNFETCQDKLNMSDERMSLRDELCDKNEKDSNMWMITCFVIIGILVVMFYLQIRSSKGHLNRFN